MELPCIKVRKEIAESTINKLKSDGRLIQGYQLRKEGEFVLIPCRDGNEKADFKEVRKNYLEHKGSFEKIGDFYVIKERNSWEEIAKMLIERGKPRAIFLDSGVKGNSRIRDLKLIYGEGEPKAFHRENHIKLYVDLSKAYFSPRLATARIRVLNNVLKFKHDVVIDMYTGIAPISILLKKNGINVYSFDINPEAVKIAKLNFQLNKVQGNLAIANSNSLAKCLAKADQIIMNNPTQRIETSLEVMEHFKGKVIHLFLMLKKDQKIEEIFKGTEILEKYEIHGYSPSVSLYYLLMTMLE